MTDSNDWTIERGTNGAGFLGISGTIVKIDSLEYAEGGFNIPVRGFTLSAIVGATAAGGVTAYYNPATGKIQLFKGTSEATGTLTNVTLVLLGH